MSHSNYNGKAAISSKNVLDHGFVALRNISGPTRRIFNGEVEHVTVNGENLVQFRLENMRDFDGDDIDPAQAARMSFGELDSSRSYDKEMGLNDYLYRNKHTSPFEMLQIWVEVRVPIMIDRQFVRHRTWRRNESSGRYIVLPEMWYIPDVVGGKSKDKKQGQEDNLDIPTQEWFKHTLNNDCQRSYDHYLEALERKVAAEHARQFLHLNHYVHWLGNVDLANLFHFMRLRTHEHAQIEARKYGWAIIELLRPHLPGLMSLYDKYCTNVNLEKK